MSDITEIQKMLLEFRDKRDWKKFNNPKDMAVSLVLEATEVLENFKWKSNEEVEQYVKVKKDAIAEELADTLNWVLLLSHDLGIDIVKASKKKIKANHKKYPISKTRGVYKKYTDL